MFRSIRGSIRRKLTTVILGTVLVALVVIAAAMVLYEARAYHSTWVEDLTTQADILGKAAEAALNFDDPAAARETLRALRLRPQVSAAAIYDGDGRLFAAYAAAEGTPAPPPRAEGAGHRLDGDQIVVFMPIAHGHEQIGTVYLRARYALLDRIGDYLLLTLLGVAASLAVAAAVAYRLQATITRPILALTNAAREVMRRRDYSLRVAKTSDDEVGVLVDAFNGMLAEAGRRAAELEATNASLQREMVERRAAEDALKAADRRKDEFLATLAHELRNPLAPIRNGLHILHLTNDPAAAASARAMMERQLRHMVRLVDDLLDVSRITTGKLVLKRERCRLADVLAAAVESARPLVEAKRHTLSTHFVDAELDADPARLAQVFSNMLNNAAKYTHEGGTIALDCRHVAGGVEVEVVDNGIGMEADKAPLVFDMFIQLDMSLERSHGGLGVGMALAKRLVEMHGGSVRAASPGPGRGSTFTVFLPAAGRTPEPSAPEHARAPAAERRRRRVLVVDDNRDFATSLGIVLEFNGHDVRLAFDGTSGLARALEFDPEIAFLDLGLPGLSGFDLARHLRADPTTRDAMLVALSGWGQEKDRTQSREAGFDAHLVKPVDPQTIARVVDDYGAPRGPVPAPSVPDR